MNLLNVGPEPIPITWRDSFFSVEFHRLDQPAKRGYHGPYQDQADFPADQYNFFINARTTSLAEIPVLRHQVAYLSGLIEELEEHLPDPDQGMRIRAEVQDKLMKSGDIPRDSLISLADMRKRI